jgi:hypothetical protein
MGDHSTPVAGVVAPIKPKHSLVQVLVTRECTECKASAGWSYNFGNESVLATLTSYGQMRGAKQGEIIQRLRDGKGVSRDSGTVQIPEALRRTMVEKGLVGPTG